jgi:hypothetical protein
MTHAPPHRRRRARQWSSGGFTPRSGDLALIAAALLLASHHSRFTRDLARVERRRLLVLRRYFVRLAELESDDTADRFELTESGERFLDRRHGIFFLKKLNIGFLTI